MIATITTRMMREDKIDDWLELANRIMLPNIEDVNGLIGGAILVDHQNSMITHVIFWDSEEFALEAENSKQFMEWNKQFEEYQTDLPLLEYCDFTVFHGNMSAYAGVR